MAIVTSLPPEKEKQGIDGRKPLPQVLKPWRARLAIQWRLRWLLNGASTGMLLAALLLVISRLVPWEGALAWALLVGGAVLLGVLVLMISYRPSLAHSARQVDGLLGLHDRLSTAWEYRDETTPLSTLQRRDALKHLNQHTPAGTISLRPGRFRLLAFAVIALMLALLLLLPNPMNDVLQQQAAFRANLSRQIADLNHLRAVIDSQSSIPPQVRAQIDRILQQTASQLAQATNQAQAQQILAQGQAQLNQQRDPQAASKAQATSAAASALANSSNPNLSAAAKALATGNPQGLSNALSKLASQVANMTPAQRAQLARQIAQAANQAAGNPALSSALQQLAKAVADGNPDEIASATQAVESAAAQANTSSAANGGIDQAAQGLQNVASAIAAATEGTGSGQPPVSEGSGQGQGQGQGPGQGQGQTPGQGSGSSGQGNNGHNGGRGEQVFVPGQVGPGTSTTTTGSGSGGMQPGSSVPYAQVIAQYAQMAHDSIDNSNIPPDLKTLVSGYFNTLEGQK